MENSNNDRIKVCVKSRKLAEDYSKEKHDETAILISIAARDQEDADVRCTDENGLKDILFLHFNDTDSLEEDSGHITDADAEQIKTFVEKYENDPSVDMIIVNCGAGQSRSAGVAAAVLMHLTRSDSHIRDDRQYTPNILCYNTVRRAFEGEPDYASIFAGQ